MSDDSQEREGAVGSIADRSGGARGSVLILVQNMSVPLDRRVWAECRALRAARYEVTVICPQGRIHDSEAHVRLDGVEIHRYPQVPAEGGVVGYLREYASAFWHISRLARRLGRERTFDVVQACNPPDFLLAAALPLKRRGARFVFDHHDLVPELYRSRFDGSRGPLFGVARLLERLSFRLADVVISTNESYRRVALTRGRKRPEDVFIVRNGPDLRRITAVGADPGLRRGKKHLIAYVGQMGPQDGVDLGIRALAELARRRRDWCALFIGDGDALPSARRLADDLGLAADVEFTGFVRDEETIRRALATADVCIAPEPKNELNDASTMMKIAEYMASGTPVVASDLAESRFTALDSALYADATDPAAFAARIDELLGDGAAREAMGARARRRVEKELSWEHAEREYLAAYEYVLSERASDRGRQ